MLVSLLFVPVASATSDVLFVGNSYTFYNNLETVVAEVFESAGDTVATRRLTAGGLRLENHVSRVTDTSTDWYTQLVTEASAREWVVLQDQSQIPGFPRTTPDWVASRDAAVVLDDMVESAGAQTMFFLTWGYVDGDSGNEWLYPDYPTMQSLLQDGYLAYAEACASAERPVWVAPVGPAFGHIRNDLIAAGEDPLASGSLFRSLYTGDGSHPSPLGSQLAAYVFFASLSGETPVGLPAPAGFDPATILKLQEAAASVVFDRDDAFTFPWEEDDDGSGIAERDTGVVDSGTAPDADTGPSVSEDTGAGELSCPTGSDESSPESEDSQDDPPFADDGSGSEGDDDESKKRGCSTTQVPDNGGYWLILLPLMGIVRRQWQFR